MSFKDMYKGKVNSPTTTLASDIAIDDTTIPLVDASVLPDAPNLATIGTDEDAETILYEGKDGNNLTTVIRGYQGEAKAWDSGTTVARMFTVYDYDTLVDNVTDNYNNLDGKANKVTFPTEDNFASLTATGDLKDSGKNASDLGEVNTASNVGDGVGLFKQKTDEDLEFKTLKARDERTEIGWTELVGNWTLNDVTYDNVSYSVGSQDTYPYGIFFKPDGSKMYMVGYTNKKVYQYSLNPTQIWHQTNFEDTDVVEFGIKESEIKLDDLGSPDDNTDLNASTSAHGLMPKLDNVSKHFITGKGTWTLPYITATIAANDTTPDVSGGNIFITSANTISTKITDLDNPTVGEIITLIGGSDTQSSTIPDGATINAVTFSGSGLNDATSGGAFTGSADTNYKVQIDAVGDTDTFKWSDDGGATWDATGVAITGEAQNLNNGVTITFGATTGHTLNDNWTFTAYPDRFKLSSNMTLGLDDSIVLYVKADNYYIELSRSTN